jgi:magnesium transporter
MAYGPDRVEEVEITDADELSEIIGRWPVTWVNVDGLGDLAVIRRLGEIFGLHNLALEDVIHVRQRPKVEDYEDYVFVATQLATFASAIETEQISLFLGKNFVLTFQEQAGDCFDPIRERIRNARGRIRQSNSDYLAYALIDAAIDTYFPILEKYGEVVDKLEDAVLTSPRAGLIPRIHHLKMDLSRLRRVIWPQRDMVNSMIRDISSLIDDQTRLHLRDCYDHTIQLLDILETYRETASGLIEIYLSGTGSRTNDIMKVLTIIATIFIPLGFIASLYGMNFDPHVSPWNMPELGWRWGYPFALALMVATAAGLMVYFRNRGWLGSSASDAIAQMEQALDKEEDPQ